MRSLAPKSRRQRLLVVVLWLVVVAGCWFFAQQRGVSPRALLGELLTAMQGSPSALLWLSLVYLVRPLLLFPVSLLTIAAGVLFGAVWGTVYASLAALSSAAVAYRLGRAFGKAPATEVVATEPISGWQGRLASYPFETVLLCRFLFVPGDLVNYTAGYLRVNFAAFIGATALGGSPGIVVGVLAGASLNSLEEADISLNTNYLVASGVLLLASLGLSWLVRRRWSPVQS